MCRSFGSHICYPNVTPASRAYRSRVSSREAASGNSPVRKGGEFDVIRRQTAPQGATGSGRSRACRPYGAWCPSSRQFHGLTPVAIIFRRFAAIKQRNFKTGASGW